MTTVIREGKRVLNMLCAPCNVCLESHAPEIQTLTKFAMRVLDSNSQLCVCDNYLYVGRYIFGGQQHHI